MFDDGIDLRELEERVWTEGAYLGRIGNVSQALHDRFVWQSPTPIGRRLQRGRPDLPLTWVEIKGKIVKGDMGLSSGPSTQTCHPLSEVLAMKTEWWYDDATLHVSGDTDLVLARLTVRDDGTAQLLLAGGQVVELESEDDASIWLVSEEYRRLEDLVGDWVEEGRPVDPRVKAPSGNAVEELLPQMVIDLAAADGTPVPTRPDDTSKNVILPRS